MNDIICDEAFNQDVCMQNLFTIYIEKECLYACMETKWSVIQQDVHANVIDLHAYLYFNSCMFLPITLGSNPNGISRDGIHFA